MGDFASKISEYHENFAWDKNMEVEFRALVFNSSRTLLWSYMYLPVTSGQPRQGSGEEKPAHSGKGGFNLFASPGVAVFFSGKILHSKK